MQALFDTEAPEAILNQPAWVEITNPEQPFGGVVITAPWDQSATVIELAAGGGGGASTESPVAGAVSSVFGRFGDVLSEHGDYTLDEIAPPVANFTLTGKMRIKADGSLQLWNPDQSKWHTLSIGGTAGGEYILIGAGET